MTLGNGRCSADLLLSCSCQGCKVYIGSAISGVCEFKTLSCGEAMQDRWRAQLILFVLDRATRYYTTLYALALQMYCTLIHEKRVREASWSCPFTRQEVTTINLPSGEVQSHNEVLHGPSREHPKQQKRINYHGSHELCNTRGGEETKAGAWRGVMRV